MELRQKISLSTATVHVGAEMGVFKFRAMGLLTVGTMRQLQANLADQWRCYPVIMADMTGATIAYRPNDPWLDYSIQTLCAVLVRPDQVNPMRAIAANRGRAGCLRRVFTDEMACESWAFRQAALIRDESLWIEPWAA